MVLIRRLKEVYLISQRKTLVIQIVIMINRKIKEVKKVKEGLDCFLD
jgi:hypothetical protein